MPSPQPQQPLNKTPKPDCLSIQDTVWQFQQSSQFTDLVLACGDGTVSAHKVMLAEVFSLLGIDENDHGQDIECVILPSVEVAVLEEALQDVYLNYDSEKLMKIFCCKSIKPEILNNDNISLFEMKEEVQNSDEEPAAEPANENEEYNREKLRISEAKNPLKVKDPKGMMHHTGSVADEVKFYTKNGGNRAYDEDGFTFKFRSSAKGRDRKYFNCVRFPSCSSKICLIGNKIYSRTGDHNHKPSADLLQVEIAESEQLKRCLDNVNNATGRTFVASVTSSLNSPGQVGMVSTTKALEMRLERAKRKVKKLPH